MPRSLQRGGRIVFVGAGTSGRLGVLESAEMPPTFGTDPSLVLAVMAGGRGATIKAKEGVEDNYEEGVRAVSRLQPTRKDVVIGVSASGMTQFVRGALTRARKAGATILFVTCDPKTELQTFVDLTIAPAVGPEVIAGSTRLKAGTATKLVLNMLTTAAMVRTGKTYGNLMVDVRSGSEKLKDRARRMVNIITGLDYDAADALLRKAKWNVKAAVVMQKTGLPLEKAVTRVRKANGLLREALGEDIEAHLRALLGLVPPGVAADQSDGGRLVDQRPLSVQLQQRRGHPGGHQSLHRRLDRVSLSRAGRHQDDGAASQDGPDAHRQRLARHRLHSPAEQVGVRSCVSPAPAVPGGNRHQPGAGSLNPMWPLEPMPRICRSIPPGARNGRLVPRAFGGRIRRHAVEKMNPPRARGSRARTGASP